MKAVILCGGSGTRLWPISRQSTPKQFVKIIENKSLFELTLLRNQDIVEEFIIVVNENQLDLCKSQVPKKLIDNCKFIIEPCARNTAPAIALAALLAGEDSILVLPSDHLIKDETAYKESVSRALDFSKEGNLVTFGIKPSYPETGFGYIEANDNDVISFKEKPILEKAKEYFSSGTFLWNSGMFCFQANNFLNELRKFRSDIFDNAEFAFKDAKLENKVLKVNLKMMKKIPAESIDYAVMEHSKLVKVVPASIQWSDLGSYDSLYEELKKDSDGNTINDNSILVNSKNNLIMSNNRLITTFDVDDLIIVDQDDSILVGKRGSSQSVKKIVEILSKENSKLLK